MKTNKNKYKIAVIGAGNGGRALAGYFASIGHSVTLLTRNIKKIKEIYNKKQIVLRGCINLTGELSSITDDIKKAIETNEIISVVTTADVHREVATKIAPFITNQIIILNPGRTFGAVEFFKILKKINPTSNVKIVETQSLIFACRISSKNSVNIIGCKNKVPYSTFPASDLNAVKGIMNELYHGFIPVENTLITGLENFGAIFHTTLVLSNLSKIERQEEFFFYNDVTPNIATLLQKIDEERLLLGQKLNLEIKSAEEWITYAYPNTSGKNLFEKLHNNPAYYKILSPKSIYERYFLEDIPTGILPMIELGKIINVETPLMNSVYNLASTLLGLDFTKTGRTLRNLGLNTFSTEKLIKYFNE